MDELPPPRRDSTMPRPPKRARKTPDDDCADRISALPDAILCHILSFLDTKYAVATSVLSTRWKDLFISVPKIKLDDCLTWKTRNKKSVLNFKDPANQTLVRAAISRNVREVDIWVENPKYAGELPYELYTSSLLITGCLETKRGTRFRVLELVSLPNLKVLLLDSLILPSDDSIRRLFRGCKLLEDLSLCRCSFVRVDVLNISIPSLRKLSFNIGDSPVINFIFEHSIQRVKLVIDTPNLEFFEVKKLNSTS
ncbi:putative F-box/LRR-repeat protein [Forsythia ovata]|uniref:F-box/LRR-repeat protein n=1 Tax=Forsythia ovata TaxID=205694 RepID=A0ABD1V1B7_9LAMI